MAGTSQFREVISPRGQRTWAMRMERAARGYLRRPRMDLSPKATDVETATRRFLLYFMLPAWLIPGVVDWVWHKKTDIEHTSGAGESLIHCLMMSEVGVPVVMGLVMEINPLTLSIMLGHTLVHEATAFWDVRYATNHQRQVLPREQHTHSFLEVLPFMAVSSIICLHWDQFLAIWGVGGRKGRWRLRLKKERLPGGYLKGILGAIVATLAVPYANELWRCVRAQRKGEAQTPWRLGPKAPVSVPASLPPRPTAIEHPLDRH